MRVVAEYVDNTTQRLRQLHTTRSFHLPDSSILTLGPDFLGLFFLSDFEIVKCLLPPICSEICRGCPDFKSEMFDIYNPIRPNIR